MPAPLRRLAPALAWAAALMAVTACAFPREPRFDAAVTAAVQDLAGDTNLLFEELALADGSVAYETRAPRYRALAAKAGTVRMLAEARGSVTGVLAVPALGPGSSDQGADPGRAAELAAEYRDATQGYMADYLRNLRLLEAADRDATATLGGRGAGFAIALARHRQAVQAYLDDLARWDAGAGPRPEPPAAAPEVPAARLDPTEFALRRVAITDILRDALIYERDILNRDR